jgi:hypothetical protein
MSFSAWHAIADIASVKLLQFIINDELLKLLFVIPANAGSSIPSEIAELVRNDEQLKQDCGSAPQ